MRTVRLASARARVSVVVGLSLLTLQGLVRGQIDAHVEPHPGARSVEAERTIDEITAADSAPTVFAGRVIGPDGAPAVGVTSAGGQAVTDAEGAFSLEADVSVDAESVRVTAVLDSGAGSLVGSVQVGALAFWGTMSAGTLVLEQAAGCQPSWLPTFGGALNATLGDRVYDLAVFDDGSGPALYVGGNFIFVGGVLANGIAKWDGSSWSALASLNGPPGLGGYDPLIRMDPTVLVLTVFDDGSGPALYAGGRFTLPTAGGVPANFIAKWDGASWLALGSGVSGASFSTSVHALTVFDDGTGPALYAGGIFTLAGGVPANCIAKWNGTSWSALGSGMNVFVDALAVYDDGSGPALYAGGEFTTAGGVPANSIAQWDGTSWSALGSGVSGFDPSHVAGLTVFDDGSGPALYAGGYFATAGGVTVNAIAKWNGSTWSALGSGMGGSLNTWVHDLTVFDDGSGPALYAGGVFTTAGGVPANYIAQWDGTSWSALGSGMGSFPTGVDGLTVFDDGSGPALYAGGTFTALDSGDSNLAKWGGCPVPPSQCAPSLGFAGPGGSVLSLCGDALAAGGQAALVLQNGPPSAPAWVVVSPLLAPTPLLGGTIAPFPPSAVVPLATDPAGGFTVPVQGGGGPATLYVQAVVYDPALPFDFGFSNALEVKFIP